MSKCKQIKHFFYLSIFRKTIFVLFLFSLLSTVCMGQNQVLSISGRVVDSQGGAISGANVILKGTTVGTLTDDQGIYNLIIPSENQNPVLIFAFMGYVQKEEAVGNRSVINVSMQEEMSRLDEIVVVAYGTSKKSTFTGSATVVKSDKIDKISGSGFAEALQGMSAGVSVVNNEGVPGADSRIQIRGISTMNGSSEPLYVVDGMPYDGKLTSISPTDIESMTVLKDAAAASLYGSRAANGVIMITTKKGKSGKPIVNFKAAWGSSDLAVKSPTKATPWQQLTNTWEGIYNDQFFKLGKSDADARKWASDNVVSKILTGVKNSNGENTYVSPFRHINEYYVLETGQINPNLQMVWNENDYDWNKAVFSRKLRQDYSFDIAGASKEGKTNYFFSASYLNDNGFALAQYFKRYNFRVNISTKVTDWLEMGANMAYSSSRQNISGFVRALVFTSTMASPWLRNVDNTSWIRSEKTGDRMLSFGTYTNNFFGAHPLASSGDYWNNPNDFNFNNRTASMISTRYYAEVKLPYEIKFRTNLGLDDNAATDYIYGSAVHGGDQQAPYGITVKTNGGSAERKTDRINSLTWNNLFTYEKKIEDHSISALLGHELYTFRQYNNSGSGEGIMQLGQFELESTTKNWSVGSFRNEYALLSFLGKIDYNYVDKYYFSASFRSDGSSRFWKENRWGTFFSLGGSWRISKEDFMQDIKWLNNLSIRSSYGTSGNDKLQDPEQNQIYYAYQATYETDNMYGNPGFKPATLATKGLKWEKNIQFNIAADFKVLGKIYGTIEYYHRKSKDLLYYKKLPLSSQVGSAQGYNTNLGNIQNSGFEITLGANAMQLEDFSWNIDANWSSLRNRITYLPSGAYTVDDRTATYKWEEGHSMYEFFMPSSAGIDSQTGNALYWIHDAGGNRVTTDDFSKVTVDDYEWQGSALPKGFGSITNTFLYKGFDFSFMLYYSYGGKMYDFTYIERVTLRGGVGVIQELVKDRWRRPGDNASLPRWSEVDYSNTRRPSNFWIFNNNYVRLRNITLGYTLPKEIIQKVNLSNVRVYFTGDNLLTFGSAKKRFSDPETGISGNNYNGNSVTDNGAPGSRRVYMAGIQVTF